MHQRPSICRCTFGDKVSKIFFDIIYNCGLDLHVDCIVADVAEVASSKPRKAQVRFYELQPPGRIGAGGAPRLAFVTWVPFLRQ